MDGNAVDIIGGHNGSIFGATATKDRNNFIGNALDFDVFSGQYVDLDTFSFLKAKEMTISMWVYLDSFAFYYNPKNRK